MMRTLYVSDLDGTLLNTQDAVSPKSTEIINGLVERGMLFTYATARSLISASVVTKGLSAKIPVIAYNGALIIHPETGEVISAESFQQEEAEKVIRCLREYQISPLVYAYIGREEKVSWLAGRENEGIQRYLSLRKGDPRLRPLGDSERMYDGEMFYYTCIGEKDELQPVYDILSRDDRYTCILQQELYRPEYWCEIMPRRATKANAVLKLKELWGCDRVISFGDAVNDIPMFRISDECYAVENAVDALKAMADGIILGNDADGVAAWLKENVHF